MDTVIRCKLLVYHIYSIKCQSVVVTVVVNVCLQVPVFDILGPATFKMIEEEENESEYIEVSY